MPVLIWVILVYISILFIQLPQIPTWFEVINFTGLILLHMLIHWYAEFIIIKRRWIYFLTQGLVVWCCALFIPTAHTSIFVSLLTALAGQSIGVYYSQRIKVFFVCTFYCILFSLSLIWLETARSRRWQRIPRSTAAPSIR